MHAMPPRITRNSDRPRALIEPWLTFKYQVRLPSFKTRLASSPPEDESHGNGKQATTSLSSKSEGHVHRQWAGSRDKNLLGVRSRENFFLDIPFYRTHRGDSDRTRPSASCRKADFSSKWKVTHCKSVNT